MNRTLNKFAFVVSKRKQEYFYGAE